MAPRTVRLGPLNRVEGDLEFHLVVDRGRVRRLDASAVMFRGWEIILRGKDPWLPISVTPRACGICGIAHVMCAVRTVEAATGVAVPEQALLLRNIIAATEGMMSGIRHHWLLFGPDLINERYRGWAEYPELVRRMQPLTGSSYRAAVRWSRRCVEITARFAGRQPHPTAVIPGGILLPPSLEEITWSLATLRDVREQFIEGVVLRGSLDEYLVLERADDLFAWLEEGEHRQGDLALFVRQAQAFGLAQLGRGAGVFMSYPAFEYPAGRFLYPGGLYRSVWLYGREGGHVPVGDPYEFQLRVAEDVSCSRYRGNWMRHPWEEETVPLEEPERSKYSWAKAPRFDGRPVEVGPLARLLCQGDPLIRDLEAALGPSLFLRQFARIHEVIRKTAHVERWLRDLDPHAPFSADVPRAVPDGRFWGWHEAHRGALCHWVVYRDGKVANYQIVSPTTWNAGPRDGRGQPGPLEAAVLDCPADDLKNPVEILHTLRSFDPCLVCTVHVLDGDRALSRFRVGPPGALEA